MRIPWAYVMTEKGGWSCLDFMLIFLRQLSLERDNESISWGESLALLGNVLVSAWEICLQESNFMFWGSKVIFNPFHGSVVVLTGKALLADLLFLCQLVDRFRCFFKIIIV